MFRRNTASTQRLRRTPLFDVYRRTRSTAGFGAGSRLFQRPVNAEVHGVCGIRVIGRAASHGCLRMLNKDIEELYTMVEVGTPVFIY